jgi:DNA segregation ATPase FtsK/SpoIIIE-like protein
LTDGKDIEAAIARLFADARAAYLHVHFASPGCYAARIDRT